MTTTDKADDLAELLSEGLDLCIRGRGLDEQVMNALEAGMGRIFPPETRCATPAIWVQQQYDTDLAEWEARAKKRLTELGYCR
jgi:hypothetical protein